MRNHIKSIQDETVRNVCKNFQYLDMGIFVHILSGRGQYMKIEIQPDGIWYHGSNMIFSELRTNSTITQWKELAEAFSHQPSGLGYDDNGVISHNGIEKGYLYIIDEPIIVGVDIYQHPRTTMDENAEFLTKRPLKVKMICEL